MSAPCGGKSLFTVSEGAGEISFNLLADADPFEHFLIFMEEVIEEGAGCAQILSDAGMLAFSYEGGVFRIKNAEGESLRRLTDEYYSIIKDSKAQVPTDKRDISFSCQIQKKNLILKMYLLIVDFILYKYSRSAWQEDVRGLNLSYIEEYIQDNF